MEVMVQCNLLERIGETWEQVLRHSNFQQQKEQKLPFSISSGLRVQQDDGTEENISYFGHLAILSNMIADMCEEERWEGLKELGETSPKWIEWTLVNLEEYNNYMMEFTQMK